MRTDGANLWYFKVWSTVWPNTKHIVKLDFFALKNFDESEAAFPTDFIKQKGDVQWSQILSL